MKLCWLPDNQTAAEGWPRADWNRKAAKMHTHTHTHTHTRTYTGKKSVNICSVLLPVISCGSYDSLRWLTGKQTHNNGPPNGRVGALPIVARCSDSFCPSATLFFFFFFFFCLLACLLNGLLTGGRTEGVIWTRKRVSLPMFVQQTTADVTVCLRLPPLDRKKYIQTEQTGPLTFSRAFRRRYRGILWRTGCCRSWAALSARHKSQHGHDPFSIHKNKI